MLSRRDAERLRENHRMEARAVALYCGLARLERDPERAKVLEDLACIEEIHVAMWAARLKEAGGDVREELRFRGAA